jgi:hypothetical protein
MKTRKEVQVNPIDNACDFDVQVLIKVGKYRVPMTVWAAKQLRNALCSMLGNPS